MDEDTTTAQDVQVADAVEAPSVDTEASDSADVQDVTDSSDTQEDATAEEPSQSEPDEKLKKFAASQGIELDSPGAIKAAQVAQKSQSEATKRSLKASELEKSSQITDVPQGASADDVRDARMRNLEVKTEVQEWKIANPDKAVLEPEMAQYLTDNPAKKELVQKGYLNFDDLYKLVKSDDAATAKSAGKREALTDLAHKQQAAVPRGSATQAGTPKGKSFGDLSIADMEKKLGFVRR